MMRTKLVLPLLIGAFFCCSIIGLRFRAHLPYVRITKALASQELQVVADVFSSTLAAGDPAAVNQTRQFGLGQNYLAGHRVIFLDAQKGPLATSVVPQLQQVAKHADNEAGWHLVDSQDGSELSPRVAELIEYEGVEEDSRRSHALGWHDDGSTLITVAVALSEADAYEGGEFETYASEAAAGQSGAVTADRVLRGDALVWRGWERHRVRPVTRGVRQVLVMEFWKQGRGVSKTVDRLPDSAKSYRDALALTPTAAGLHAGLGSLLARHEQHTDAESSFTIALKLAPTRPDFHVRLGHAFYLQTRLTSAMKHLSGLRLPGLGSDQPSAEQRRAEESFLKAAELDPSLAEAQLYLGKLYADLGDKIRSEKHNLAAKTLDPSAHNATDSGAV